MIECLQFVSENEEFWTEFIQDGQVLSGAGTDNSLGLSGGVTHDDEEHSGGVTYDGQVPSGGVTYDGQVPSGGGVTHNGQIQSGGVMHNCRVLCGGVTHDGLTAPCGMYEGEPGIVAGAVLGARWSAVKERVRFELTNKRKS